MKEIVSIRADWEHIEKQLSTAKNIIDELRRAEASLNRTIGRLNECEDLTRSNTVSLDINGLEEQRKALFDFSKQIHRQLLHDVDTPFYYATMRTLRRLYRLNPSDIQYQDQTDLIRTPITLSVLGTSLLLDQKLREDYLRRMKQLDEDDLSDIQKNMMIDSIGKYFEDKGIGDGEKESRATEYMRSPIGSAKYDEIKTAREIVIEYYELLHAENAKKMNNLFKDMDETDFPHYQEDIDNIKFIVYTAKEPYHSVFFEYIDQLKIADYNTEVKDKKTGEVRVTQFFMPSRNTLHLNFNGERNRGLADLRGPYFTFFHEVGHGIDDVSRPEEGRFLGFKYRDDQWYQLEYKNSDGDTLYDVAKRDFEHNLEKTIYEVAESINMKINTEDIDYLKDVFVRKDAIEIEDSDLEEIYEKIEIIYSEKLHGGINSTASDVYGGITNNKLKGNWGHMGEEFEDYWYDQEGRPTKAQSSELFADLFATSMTNHKKQEEATRVYFPKVYPYFEEMIKGLKNEIK